MYLAILAVMAVMLPIQGRQIQLWTQFRDFRCYCEASQRMGKVETFLEPWWLNLYYFERRPYLKRPTRDSPFLRYCTPRPFSLFDQEQEPMDFTQSQLRLKLMPNFLSCLLYLPSKLTSKVSSSSLLSFSLLKLIFLSSLAMFSRKASGVIKAGFWKTFPKAEASIDISFCSLTVNTPFFNYIFRSYLFINLLLAAGVPSAFNGHRSNIFIFHCILTRSYLEDSLLDVLGSIVVSWSSFLLSSKMQKTLVLVSIAATSLCHQTALLLSPALLMNILSPSRCTAIMPTGEFCQNHPYSICPSAVLTNESPLSIVPLHLDSIKLNSSSNTTPVPSNTCSSFNIPRSQQPWQAALMKSP